MIPVILYSYPWTYWIAFYFYQRKSNRGLGLPIKPTFASNPMITYLHFLFDKNPKSFPKLSCLIYCQIP